jgi:hypothetical protein
VKYYLIILFLISNFFLFTIVNINTYGFEVAKVNYLNNFKSVPLIPVKAKILPQYDESVPQPINKVKSTTEVKVNDVKEALNPTESAPASMGIKILSPKSGKEIPDGNLTILGISTDTEKTDCTVSVDLNNQKPFQKAKATGPYGDNDYSSWTFTYSPAYHTIENGINDLTSKLECVENSKVITKWHSINVTGVTTEDSKPASSLVFHDPLGILPQLKTVSTNPSASNIGKSNNDTTTASDLSARLQLLKDRMYSTESQNSTMSLPVPKQLLVEASLLKGLVTSGDTQTVDVKVLDANTNETVSGADVVAKIGKTNYSNGTSDASGAFSHSWNITSNTPSGKYDVLVSASANGYEPASITGNFQVQKQLLVEASLLKDVVAPGDSQNIDVKVLDANTNETVSGADVVAKIGKSNDYSGTSDASGAFSHSWNITSNTPSGKYDVLVSASANGYEPASISGNFQVQKQLLVEASLLKDPVVPGDKQSMDVKVLDANNKQAISGVNVMTNIGGKKISEKTDANGIMSYSWDTPATSGDNAYQINLDLLSKDYPKVTKSISFKMDKPQNLLEPPISNYVDKVISTKSNDIKNELDSQNKFQECTRILSSFGCSLEGKDKSVLNPTVDDKSILNPPTDDKPILNDHHENEKIHNENTQKVDNVFDFLAPVSK